MKKENTALLIFRTMFAVIFSVLLIAALIALPFYHTATAITKPEKLSAMVGDVVKSIDLTEVVELPESIELGDYAIDDESLHTILKSEAARDILGTCTEQMLLAYTSGDPTIVYDKSTIETILTEKADKLDEIIEYIPDSANLPVEELRQRLATGIATYSEKILEQLPAQEDLQEMVNDDDAKDKVTDKVENALGDKIDSETMDEAIDKAEDTLGNLETVIGDSLGVAGETINTVQKAFSPAISIAAYGTTALLALLVFLCRYKNLNGLIWVGIDCLLASLPLNLICTILGGGSLLANMLAGENIPASAIASILDVVLADVRASVILLAIVGVVLILLGIIYKVVKNKRRKKETPPSTPIPLSQMV